MIQRAIIIATANWALLALPCICTGGYLRHPCSCPSSAHSGCCDSEIECDCDSGHTGCGHESSCENDPCDFVVTRLEQPSTSVAAIARAPSCLAVISSVDPYAWREFTRCEVVLSACRDRHIPFHESDVPLLI